jgi:hypothetical protein
VFAYTRSRGSWPSHLVVFFVWVGGWLVDWRRGIGGGREGLGFLDCKVGRKDGIYFNLMHVLILSMDFMGDGVL